MKIIGALGLVVAAACVIPQQQQQPTYGQPQYGQQGTQGAQAAGTCPMLIDCYTRCTDANCIAACEGGVDPNVVYAGRTYTNCLMQNGCRDASCAQTQCGGETAACYGAASTVAQGGAQTPGMQTSGGQTPAYPTATPAAGAHTELWMGIRQTGLGSSSSYTANVGWYVLFDDGRVLAHLPSEGLEGVDENQVGTDGTWVRSGKDIEMVMDQYRLVFTARADGGWDSREGSFWPIGGLDGAVLDGGYGPSAGAREIAFSSDGRFEATAGLMYNSGGNGLVVTPRGSGTYRIAHNTITLSYAGGQSYRISISTLHADEMPRPSSVFFGGFEYHQK